MNDTIKYKISLRTIIKTVLIAVFLISTFTTATVDVLASTTNFEDEPILIKGKYWSSNG